MLYQAQLLPVHSISSAGYDVGKLISAQPHIFSLRGGFPLQCPPGDSFSEAENGCGRLRQERSNQEIGILLDEVQDRSVALQHCLFEGELIELAVQFLNLRLQNRDVQFKSGFSRFQFLDFLLVSSLLLLVDLKLGNCLFQLDGQFPDLLFVLLNLFK